MGLCGEDRGEDDVSILEKRTQRSGWSKRRFSAGDVRLTSNTSSTMDRARLDFVIA